MLKRVLPSIFFLLAVSYLCAYSLKAQTVVYYQDTVKLMQYNLLRFPGTTGATRFPLLKKVLNYTKPDLFMINEMSVESGGDQILNQALNINGERDWARVKFIRGSTIGPYNMLFYKRSKFRLKSQDSIAAQPRATTVSRLYVVDSALGNPAVPDTNFITIAQMHLLSSNGSTEDSTRGVQTAGLRTWLLNNSTDSNFVAAGDFNLYHAAEKGYQNLLAPGQFQFWDPINKPGAWSNNAAFANVHTQSPRTTSFGGGATGGMDDRFDFILTSHSMQFGRHNIQNIVSSYTSVGNDGQHFNGALTTLPNGQVPDSIALALHGLSDHLPVTMRVAITKRKVVTGLDNLIKTIQIKVSNPNPNYFVVSDQIKAGRWQLINQLGALVQEGQIEPNQSRQPLPEILTSGVYMLRLIGQGIVGTARIVRY